MKGQKFQSAEILLSASIAALPYRAYRILMFRDGKGGVAYKRYPIIGVTSRTFVWVTRKTTDELVYEAPASVATAEDEGWTTHGTEHGLGYVFEDDDGILRSSDDRMFENDFWVTVVMPWNYDDERDMAAINARVKENTNNFWSHTKNREKYD